MRRTRIANLTGGITALAVLLLVGPLAPEAQGQSRDLRFQTDEEAVQFTFARYRNAILARDGATAYDCVDTNTRAYYDRLIDLIHYGDSETLRQQTYTDLTIILSSRQFIDRDTLVAMTGKDLFENAVNRGWSDRELVAAGLGPVAIDGETAVARATISNVHTLFHWVFRWEDTRWRLDLAAQLEGIDDGIRLMLRDEGLDPVDLAFAMLVRGAGPDEVTDDVWDPLLER
jgi:hypothetical protein